MGVGVGVGGPIGGGGYVLCAFALHRVRADAPLPDERLRGLVVDAREVRDLPEELVQQRRRHGRARERYWRPVRQHDRLPNGHCVNNRKGIEQAQRGGSAPSPRPGLTTAGASRCRPDPARRESRSLWSRC